MCWFTNYQETGLIMVQVVGGTLKYAGALLPDLVALNSVGGFNECPVEPSVGGALVAINPSLVSLNLSICQFIHPLVLDIITNKKKLFPSISPVQPANYF